MLDCKVVKGMISFIIKTFLLFFYIYNTPIIGLPTFAPTIRITSVAFLFIYLLGTYKKMHPFFCVSRQFCNQTYGGIVVLSIYALLLYMFVGAGTGTHILPTMINMITCSMIVVYLLPKIYNDIEEFMYSLFWVSIIQSIFIWLSILFPVVLDILDSIFLYNIEHAELRELNYAGGLACTAAPGAIKYSFGLICCLYMLRKKHSGLYVFIYLIFVLTGSMVARTSFLLGLIGLFFMPIIARKDGNNKKIVGFVFSLVITLGFIYYLIMTNTSFFAEQFLRLTYLFDVGIDDAFLRFYVDGAETAIPPISEKTIWGTGVYSGMSANGVFVNADGGFVKNYVALGLISVTICYILFFISTYRLSLKYRFVNNKYLMLYFAIYMLLSEFKEWILLDMYMLCIYFTIAILLEKQEKTIIVYGINNHAGL